MQEAEYRDADCRLVAEDMAVMTDFELHNLCLRHQVFSHTCVCQSCWTTCYPTAYVATLASRSARQSNKTKLISLVMHYYDNTRKKTTALTVSVHSSVNELYFTQKQERQQRKELRTWSLPFSQH